MSYSNQEKVQAEVSRISQKKRKERSEREKVRLFQLKLYDKAKQEEGYCFYVLYDKLFLSHTLSVAYEKVRQNGGSPGVDGQSFKDIESYGRTRFLSELGESLRTRTYRPKAVKRVWIAKANGGQRPLGIPTIRDRVAQAACKLIIEPIFDADFIEESYGFRPKRSAKDAMRQIKENLQSGYREVYDADLSKYFDTIPHDKLMIALGERISDSRLLKLIKLWLKAPIAEEDGTYSGGKKSKVGTPQGGVISPLLANIYMNLFDRIIARMGGKFEKAGVKIVRYADDFVLMARELKDWILEEVESLLTRMELQINKEKTKVVKASEDSFAFLGFSVRYDRDAWDKAKKYWNISASEKSLTKIRKNIDAKLRAIGHYPPERVVEELNPVIRGWINYFKIKGVSYHRVPARKLQYYLTFRISRYYKRKSQRKSRLHGPQAYQILIHKYGMINLAKV